jgi:hypothetical protein
MMARVAVTAALVCFGATQARAEAPAPDALLAEFGFTPDEISQVHGGQILHKAEQAASERELATALAFQVPVPPTELVQASKSDILDKVDPNVTSFGVISGGGSAADFAKLTLQPDAQKRAQAYTSAGPGGDLNLSAEEIASFQKLGGGAAPAAVEAQVRASLLARLQAYQAQGLAGIAPYARGDGKTRSAGDELRTASLASKKLQTYAASAYQLLLDYPKAKPPGTLESFHWSQFEAHGVPTIALTHVLLVPDGGAWVVAQRQFYVSTGYNSEQAVAGFLPVATGTMVVYANRTSTDQVTGMGGGTKRSIGSKLLASQLEALFEKSRATLK